MWENGSGSTGHGWAADCEDFGNHRRRYRVLSIDYCELAKDVTSLARKKGAEECDCFIEVGRKLSITVRRAEVESIERASFEGLGVRVLVDKQLGFGFTTELSPEAIEDLVQRCYEFALSSTPDPDGGVTEIPEAASEDLEIFDSSIDDIPAGNKVDLVLSCEQAAYDYDSKIKNTYGTAYEEARARVILATSKSDPISYEGTHFELGCVPVAETDDEKRLGIWYSSERFFSDLESEIDIGRKASKRAVSLLGAKTTRTRKAPVVFDPITATEVVKNVFGALDGENVLRGTSFLKGRKDTRVGSELATFVDDGRMPRKLGTKPFDGEGMPTRRAVGIQNGTLRTYFYDSRSAKRSGAQSTGNASRGYGTIPCVGANNFYLVPGRDSDEDIIAGIKDGLLVTRLLGFGVNLTTGGYSRGAEGLWIENGKISHPVDGITIAGNLSDMLLGIEGIASNLHFFGHFGSPSFLVKEMTIAGG